MLKFVSNLNMLFGNEDIKKQFQKASKAGFRVVEMWTPFGTTPETLLKAKNNAGVKLLQFGMDEGDESAGDCGLLSIPNKMTRFKLSAINEIQLARFLKVEQMNCLCGIKEKSYTIDEQLDCMKDNLKWLHPLLEKNKVNVNIEFISSTDKRNYLFAHSKELFSFLLELNFSRIGLQFDFFHFKMMGEDLIKVFTENFQLIRHIQIADVPGRHQPGTGAIDFKNILKEIEKSGYDKYISLEYLPLGSVEESLLWLPEDCRIQCNSLDLNL